MDIRGRTALVTGASRGLGRAIALRLAAEGARVALNYVQRKDDAERVAQQIGEAGGVARVFQADVGNFGEVEQMVRAAEQELGPIDFLVNNAGVFRRLDVENFDDAQFSAMRQTNVDGLVYVTLAVARRMKERGRGRIVNVSSIAAHGTSMPGTTFYAATKAAVSLMTRRFALELGPYGIAVNALAPGFILTDIIHEGRTPEEVERLQADILAKTMMRRLGRPEDIASAAVFLLTQEFLTAQVLTVDGGRMDYLAP